MPLVAEPASAPFDGETKLAAVVKPHSALIKRALAEDGALLFRGFSVDDRADFETSLNGLGLPFQEGYVGGASPRKKLQGAVYTSTEVPAPFIIGFHTEQAIMRWRPSTIAFYGETAPKRYGETPIFDCARVFDSLPKPLQERLADKGALYRRFFPTRRSALNFKKTWGDSYSTDDRAEVESALRAEGAAFQWTDRGLMTEMRLPAVLVDPVSGRPCLNMSLYEGAHYMNALRRFRTRYHTLTYVVAMQMARREDARPDAFIRTMCGDGTAFSAEDQAAFSAAVWDNAVIFPWKPHDVLILNNIRFAHGRLNVEGQRRVLASLIQPYDVHTVATFH